jgi:hypothetical protein
MIIKFVSTSFNDSLSTPGGAYRRRHHHHQHYHWQNKAF